MSTSSIMTPFFVRAVVARNRLKRMLVDNGSSVNILFGVTFVKMIVDHELTPITIFLYDFTCDSIITRHKINTSSRDGRVLLDVIELYEVLDSR